jgi:hypothetical protein
MFLQNPSQLLLLQFLGSSFGLNIHPQLEGCVIVYYVLKACIYLEKDLLFLYCNLYINYCILS